MTPPISKLDYIEVPNDKWYYSKRNNEVYQFDNGRFSAHPRLGKDMFHTTSTLKVLPDDALVANIERCNNDIKLTPATIDIPPTWRMAMKVEDMVHWLFRRNKCHHQQVAQDKSFPTTADFVALVGEHGTAKTVDSILDGTIDLKAYDFAPHVKD